MSISFACPHCRASTEVADQYAGQSGPCKSCGQEITIPSLKSTVTVDSRRTAGTSTGCAIAIAVLGIVGLIGLVGVLVGGTLLLPAVGSAREAARRMQCSNNLKHLALAMHNYHSVYGTFPPAHIPDENGDPMHSWRVLLLPFLEHPDLYDQYDFSQPWDSPENQILASQMPSFFSCPSAINAGAMNTTSYMVTVGPATMFPGGEALRIADITDGTSNTLMIVEVSGKSANWLDPTDVSLSELSDLPAVAGHPGGLNAALADGSV